MACRLIFDSISTIKESFRRPSKQYRIGNSPFLTVVNYISAESFYDTTEVEKYIDVEKVFAPYIDDKNLTAHQAWIDLLTFQNALGKDKKFTNKFPFHKYSVKETFDGDTARIVFTSKEEDNDSIEYALLSDEYQKWKIIAIKYSKCDE